MASQKNKNLHIRIEEDLKQEFIEKCDKEIINSSEWVRRQVKKFINGVGADWISVKEGLPKEEGHYWVIDDYQDWQFKGEWKRDKWSVLSNEPFSATVTITHWMPLPEPPNS